MTTDTLSPPDHTDDVVAPTRAEHEPVAVGCQAGCAATRLEDRLRDRPRGRCRVRNRARLRFRGGSAQSPALPRTHAAFPFVSLCDISTPGCNSLRSSPASSELVAHRVVAGRRSLHVGSRRSALGVLPGVLAFTVARWGHPANPSLMRRLAGRVGPPTARDRRAARATGRRALAGGWGGGLR
jgi:hypothetical protein